MYPEGKVNVRSAENPGKSSFLDATPAIAHRPPPDPQRSGCCRPGNRQVSPAASAHAPPHSTCVVHCPGLPLGGLIRGAQRRPAKGSSKGSSQGQGVQEPASASAAPRELDLGRNRSLAHDALPDPFLQQTRIGCQTRFTSPATSCRFSFFLSSGTALTWPAAGPSHRSVTDFFSPICQFPQRRVRPAP